MILETNLAARAIPATGSIQFLSRCVEIQAIRQLHGLLLHLCELKEK